MQLISIEPKNTEDACDLSRLQVRKVVHSSGNARWFFNYHSHEDMTEIILVAGGKGIYTLNNMPVAAVPGDLVIFNSGKIHAVASDPAEPLDAWTLGVSGFSLRDLPQNHILPENLVHVIHMRETAPVIRAMMEEIYRQQTTEDGNSYRITRELGAALILLADQAVRLQGVGQKSGKPSFAVEILRYLDLHFREMIRMDDIAEHFHMSAGYISHEMSREFHVSPISYLINRRISEAQWELIMTEKTVKEIAASAGYENVSHFSSLFRKRTGCLPLEFRERYRKKEGPETPENEL